MYVHGDLPDVPNWDPAFLVKQTQGTKYQSHMYRMSESSSFGRVPSEDCTSLSKWIGDDEVQDLNRIDLNHVMVRHP